MEERTYISEQEASCLYVQLEKCNHYRDAKKLLDTFVIDFIREQGGKVYHGGYGFDENENVVKIEYRNSMNPKDVKDELANVVRRLANYSIRATRLFDNYEKYGYPVTEPATEKDFEQYRKMFQEVEAARNKSMQEIEDTAQRLGFSIKKQDYFNHKAGDFDMPTFLDSRKAHSDRAEEILEYIDKWKKASVPVIDDKAPRLRPINGMNEERIRKLFDIIIDLGWIGRNANVAPWLYLCGITDEEPKERIEFLGTNYDMAILIEAIFLPQTGDLEYFIHDGITIEYICQFFLKNGKPMKSTCISSSKTRKQKNKGNTGEGVTNKDKVKASIRKKFDDAVKSL